MKYSNYYYHFVYSFLIMASPAKDEICLGDIYEEIWKDYEKLEESSENVSSENVQDIVKTAIDHCYKAIEKINQLELFSDNEDVEEVTTNELKYLLIPAFIGYFTNKDTSEDRELIVKKCLDFNKNFLILCRQYSLTTFICKDQDKDGKSAISLNSIDQLKSDSVTRQQKIDRYKNQKKLEKQLQSLYSEIKKSHVDEDTKREYFLKLIEKWISTSIENIESLEEEKEILNHIKKLKQSNPNGKELFEKNNNKKAKFQPFIITKDKMQKSVFGYGYPGVPTVSVDEFYDQRVRDGIFPSASNVTKVQPNEEEVEERREEETQEKEDKQDRDDEEAIMQARALDDYKDNHRRGWGNRHNRS